MVSSTMFTYYCIGAMGLLILLSVCSELFIGLAPASYAEAAPLFRPSAPRSPRRARSTSSTASAASSCRRTMYVAMLTSPPSCSRSSGAALAGPLGGYGVALAGVVGSLMGAAGFAIAIQRGKRPIPFQWGRIAASVAIGGALVALVSASPLTGAARVAQDLAVLAVYPVLLVALGVIPRAVVRDVLAVGRAAIPLRPGSRRLAERVEALPHEQRAAIARWVGQEPVGRLSLEVDPRDEASLAALARGVRTISGTARTTEQDAAIGAYLTHRGSHIDHDQLAEQLVGRGADALDLHLLDDAYQTLRQGRRLRARRRGVEGEATGLTRS